MESEPRISTNLRLRQRDRELLEKVGALTNSSMSGAASFIFDRAGEQVLNWIETGPQVKEAPTWHQPGTNLAPTLSHSDTTLTPLRHQAGSDRPKDAFSDLELLA